MKTVFLQHPLNEMAISSEPIVLALGFFDGVHRGHQHVIRTARKVADEKKLPLAVMTFNQSPRIIYEKIDPMAMKYLTLIDRKAELFAELQVDLLYVVDYTESFGSQTPQEFVDNYIVGLHADTVVAGFDYTYGSPELANMKTLPLHAQDRFDVIRVEELQSDGEKIGTRHIMSDLHHHRIAAANSQLGYSYQFTGQVIHGFKRGRELGFPTANLAYHPNQLIPQHGVYITAVFYQGQWYPAMTSIGFNVTFGDLDKLSIETHILNFDKDIYGQQLPIRWLEYIRGEIKFNSLADLINQMERDRQLTDDYFIKHPNKLQKTDFY